MSTQAQPLTALAAKVKERIELARSKPVANTILTEVSQDDEECAITFKMDDFIRAIGANSTGKTEGASLNVNGEFTRDVEGVGPVTFAIKGTNWLTARVVL